MKVLKVILLFIAFPLLPILYLCFRSYIVDNWNSFESLTALASYCIAIVSIYYNSNSRVFFFIRRLLSYLKYDHTTWKFAIRYTGKIDTITMAKIKEELIKNDYSIVQENRDSLSALFNKKVYVAFNLENHIHEKSLVYFSSEFDVPFRLIKTYKKQFSRFFGSFESFISSFSQIDKRYEFEINYHDGSPFYSYWIRKIPDHDLSTFNAKILTPKLNCEAITVDKRKVKIISNNYHEILDDINSIVLFQGL